MENLKELFAIPVSAYPVVEIDGYKLYGSETLNRTFIEAMKNNSISKPVWKKIESLISKNIIIPCYLSKGVFSFFINKIFCPYTIFADTLGFFSLETKKIYIVVDNWAGLFGSANDSKVARTLLHELIHRCAAVKNTQFLSHFKREIVDFYEQFFIKYFSLKNLPAKSLQNIVSKLTKLEVGTRNIDLGKFAKLYMKTFSNYSNLSEKDLKMKVVIYWNMVYYFFMDYQKFRLLLRTQYYKDIYKNLFSTYEQVLQIRPNGTLVFQELFCPSEIICLFASHGELSQLQKLYSAIDDLA